MGDCFSVPLFLRLGFHQPLLAYLSPLLFFEVFIHLISIPGRPSGRDARCIWPVEGLWHCGVPDSNGGADGHQHPARYRTQGTADLREGRSRGRR